MAEKNKKTDIDIDFPDRNKAVSVLDHTPASIIKNNHLEKHNTGVYFHLVPTDPLTNLSSVDYQVAESNGWFKIDLLNVSVYEQISNEKHLLDLMGQEINWDMFQMPDFTTNLIHLGNHSELVKDLKPTNINELAVVLALIRPGKRHLIDRCKRYGFNSIQTEIWEETNDGSYYFKAAHSFSYAMLVKVHACLLIEQAMNEPEASL